MKTNFDQDLNSYFLKRINDSYLNIFELKSSINIIKFQFEYIFSFAVILMS